MDREKYIQMRKSNEYDLNWFYQYYLENKKSTRDTLPLPLFQQAFNMYFQMNGREVLEYLDKKMQVTKIENEQGTLLYIA